MHVRKKKNRRDWCAFLFCFDLPARRPSWALRGRKYVAIWRRMIAHNPVFQKERWESKVWCQLWNFLQIKHVHTNFFFFFLEADDKCVLRIRSKGSLPSRLPFVFPMVTVTSSSCWLFLPRSLPLRQPLGPPSPLPLASSAFLPSVDQVYKL